MHRSASAVILFPVLSLLPVPSLSAADRRDLHDTDGVLRGLSIASFKGSSKDSIQAVATDSSGNIYVAGTTYSPRFPVKNAVQSSFAEARILRSTDLGVTWTRVGFPPSDVSVLAADPGATQVLFAAGLTAIYKSNDAGQSWQTVYSFSSGYSSISAALAIDPWNHLRLAALTPGTGAVIRSVDGGTTWTSGGATCSGSTCGGQLIADPAGTGTLVVAGILAGGYISRDWGLTFQALNPPGCCEISTAAFDPSHPGWIYAGTGRGVAGSLFLSTDYGATWTPKPAPVTVYSNVIFGLAVDPDQPKTLVAECADGLYVSTDGAASWTRRAAPYGPQTTTYFSPETGPSNESTFVLVHHSCNTTGGIFAVGSGGIPGGSGVAFSPDFGATWTTPQLSNVNSVSSGPGCTLYATRRATSDVFVAKTGPDGSNLWATYLGGSDQDAAVALKLDAQGNVYIAGNTMSPDFPVSVPHIGPIGESSLFLVKLSSDGGLLYAVTIGGEAVNTAVALAVDASQNAYLAGKTNSLKFPITPGVLGTNLSAGSYSGILAKLSASATLTYSTNLGESYTFPGAILVDADEEPIIGGAGSVPGTTAPPGGSEFVMKLDRGASQILSSAYLSTSEGASGVGVTGMAFDSQNNLVLFGQTATGGFQGTPGAYSSPQPVSPCPVSPGQPYAGAGDAFVMKLSAVDWHPIYGALFSTSCAMETGEVAVDAGGSAVLAMAGYGGLPLRSPLMAGPACAQPSSAIAKLSADGSTLQFASYLPNCGIPGIALASDGSIYAGVSPLSTSDTTSVLRLGNLNPAAVSLDQISNAFSGYNNAVAAGGLYSLAISGFEPRSIDLGLNPPTDLPDRLGGVEVKFNGTPAAILSTSAKQIIVAAPSALFHARVGTAERTGITSVELIYNGAASNTVLMPVSKSLPGLLTIDYPNAPPYLDSVDANARNQDGTMNDADHPAATGSTITLFATGMGATTPAAAPGSIAHSSAVLPITPLFSTWEVEVLVPGEGPLPFSAVPGFVSAIFQTRVPVPANLPGTDLGNGVKRVSVGLLLQLTLTLTPFTPPVSNWVGVYVK